MTQESYPVKHFQSFSVYHIHPPPAGLPRHPPRSAGQRRIFGVQCRHARSPASVPRLQPRNKSRIPFLPLLREKTEGKTASRVRPCPAGHLSFEHLASAVRTVARSEVRAGGRQKSKADRHGGDHTHPDFHAYNFLVLLRPPWPARPALERPRLLDLLLFRGFLRSCRFLLFFFFFGAGIGFEHLENSVELRLYGVHLPLQFVDALIALGPGSGGSVKIPPFKRLGRSASRGALETFFAKYRLLSVRPERHFTGPATFVAYGGVHWGTLKVPPPGTGEFRPVAEARAAEVPPSEPVVAPVAPMSMRFSKITHPHSVVFYDAGSKEGRALPRRVNLNATARGRLSNPISFLSASF